MLVYFWLISVQVSLPSSLEACSAAVSAKEFREAEATCRAVIDEPRAWLGVGLSILYGEFTEDEVSQLVIVGVDGLPPMRKARLRKALVWLRRAAEAGVSHAQFYYGIFHGLGTMARSPEARQRNRLITDQWLTKAAKQDHLEANILLSKHAYVDFNGLIDILDRDYLPYLQRAAELGHSDSGRVVQELEQWADDRTRADAYLASDNIEGLRQLGQYKLDRDEAGLGYAYLNRAADLGDVAAMKHMAAHYRWADDQDRYRYYLEKAVAHGDAESMLRLGDVRRENGDQEGAKRLYCRAFKLDHAEAPYALAEENVQPEQCHKLIGNSGE